MLSLVTVNIKGHVVMNIFEAVRREIGICQYLKEKNISIQPAGENLFRGNPCPICGHKDCFTIYEQNQTFNCFSCGAAGDVIHLEKHFYKLASNFEAA